MGWTFYALRGKPQAECDRMLTWENENGKRRVLKSSMVGSTYYAAVEQVHPSGARIVWAAIFLTKSCPRAADGYNFGYKDMDETVNPYEARCPVGILNLLTKAANTNAEQWRAKCREFAKRHQKRPKPGDVIVLDKPLKFSDGFEGTRFRVEKIQRRRQMLMVYRSMDNGCFYRISNITERAWSLEDQKAAAA